MMNGEENQAHSRPEGQEDALPEKKRTWLLPLLSSLLFGFTLFVFAPLETWFSAGAELWFTVEDFLWPALAAFLTVSGVLFGVGMLLRGAGRSAFCALLFGLALALYVQGGFANADYGVLDGRAIDWPGFGDYPVWNTLMWVALALLPVVAVLLFRARAEGALRFLCVLLALTQAVSGFTLALTTPRKGVHTEIGFTTTDEFVLSGDRNILVFVLDTLDTTSFSDLLMHEPELAERLDGFTWFPKMVGQYPVTTFAMPMLLTGSGYLYETSKGNYLTTAWEKETFFHALKAEGYDVNVYSESEYAMPEAASLIDNIEEQPLAPTSAFALWSSMMRLTGFRYAPHLLKPSQMISTTDFDALKRGANTPVYTFDDTAFLSGLRERGFSAEKDAPNFKLYHLQGAHTPYNLRLDGTRGSSTIHEQLMALMNALLDMMEQMKAQGVYESSTIVITADHGNMTIDPAPVLLVKRPGDSGALKQNGYLVCQQDLHATIAAAAGLKGDIPYGMDAFAITADDWREAAYYNYYWKEADRFYEYNVTADDEGELVYAWTGRVYEYGDVKEMEMPAYTLGTEIPFVETADAVSWMDEMSGYFLQKGESGVWFGQPAARLRLRVADEEYGDLRVTFGVAGIIGESQTMKVVYDDTVQDEVVIARGDSEAGFTIPWDMLTDGEVTVTLRFPEAVSDYRQSGWTENGLIPRAVELTGMRIESVE